MQFVIGSAIFTAAAVSSYLFASLGMYDGMSNVREGTASSLPAYLGFISVMMTTVTAVLTALAIGISIVAIFTFRGIKREMQETATRLVKEILGKKITDEYVQEAVKKVVFAEIDLERQESNDEGDTFSKNPDRD